MRGRRPGLAWSISPGEEERRAFVNRALSGWSLQLRELLLAAPQPTLWPLFGVGDGHWTDSRDLVLIGDAAHAMLPFAAQGAVMAIEDAYDLAGMVNTMPVGAALVHFESVRRARVARVRARGDFNRFAYHARGPVRIARDVVFCAEPGIATCRQARLDLRLQGRRTAGLTFLSGTAETSHIQRARSRRQMNQIELNESALTAQGSNG